MLIGLSLSYCVNDIINGRVDKNNVMFIIAGTRINCERELNDVLENYAKYYWYDNPELGMEIARDLYNQGLILQPRVMGYRAPHVADGWWANISKDI